MDGHFVPNLSMGPEVVRDLRKVTRLPLEVHLMVRDPAMFVEPFLKVGADSLIVHREVLPDPRPLIEQLHQKGKRVGLAVNPESPVEWLEPFLPLVDLALCMTVHPGFEGQKYLPESPDRIRKLRELIQRHNPACELEVDGGINGSTGAVSVQAGANVLVAATAIFHAPGGAAAGVRALRAAGVAADLTRGRPARSASEGVTRAGKRSDPVASSAQAAKVAELTEMGLRPTGTPRIIETSQRKWGTAPNTLCTSCPEIRIMQVRRCAACSCVCPCVCSWPRISRTTTPVPPRRRRPPCSLRMSAMPCRPRPR